MGELRKRGDVWWIRYYRNGRRFEESARTDKYEKARDQLKLKEGDIAKGVPVSPRTSRYRFDEAKADILAEYKANGRRSIGELTRRIELHLEPTFGRARMGDITTSDVRAFTKARLDAGASAGEVNRELAALKRMFSLAVKGNRLLFKPHIPMLQEDNVRRGFVDDEQFAAVYAKLPPAIQPIARFAYITGWRIQSEVLPLQWRQVDRKSGEVRLDPGTTKNRAGRVFPFTDALRALFAERWSAHERLRKAGKDCPHVFERQGEPVRSIRGAWAAACADAGCPGRIPHDLRRSAVRNMERRGLSRSVAMQLTGHKTEAVYRRYAITSEADLREGVERLNEARPAARKPVRARQGQKRDNLHQRGATRKRRSA